MPDPFEGISPQCGPVVIDANEWNQHVGPLVDAALRYGRAKRDPSERADYGLMDAERDLLRAAEALAEAAGEEKDA